MEIPGSACCRCICGLLLRPIFISPSNGARTSLKPAREVIRLVASTYYEIIQLCCLNMCLETESKWRREMMTYSHNIQYRRILIQ